MYNEVASLLPDKGNKGLVVNTGVKLLIRNLECIERKHTLVLSLVLAYICYLFWHFRENHTSEPRIVLVSIKV